MKPLTEKEIDGLSKADIAQFIDHTVLKANTVTADVDKLCNEAKQYKFCSVCVNSCRVPHAVNALKGTGVEVCTGFSTSGAKAEDIALMRKTVGPDVGVKASGGIRTFEDAVAMLRAGATRIGCGAGVAIIA